MDYGLQKLLPGLCRGAGENVAQIREDVAICSSGAAHATSLCHIRSLFVECP